MVPSEEQERSTSRASVGAANSPNKQLDDHDSDSDDILLERCINSAMPKSRSEGNIHGKRRQKNGIVRRRSSTGTAKVPQARLQLKRRNSLEQIPVVKPIISAFVPRAKQSQQSFIDIPLEANEPRSLPSANSWCKLNINRGEPDNTTANDASSRAFDHAMSLSCISERSECSSMGSSRLPITLSQIMTSHFQPDFALLTDSSMLQSMDMGCSIELLDNVEPPSLMQSIISVNGKSPVVSILENTPERVALPLTGSFNHQSRSWIMQDSADGLNSMASSMWLLDQIKPPECMGDFDMESSLFNLDSLRSEASMHTSLLKKSEQLALLDPPTLLHQMNDSTLELGVSDTLGSDTDACESEELPLDPPDRRMHFNSPGETTSQPWYPWHDSCTSSGPLSSFDSTDSVRSRSRGVTSSSRSADRLSPDDVTLTVSTAKSSETLCASTPGKTSESHSDRDMGFRSSGKRHVDVVPSDCASLNSNIYLTSTVSTNSGSLRVFSEDSSVIQSDDYKMNNVQSPNEQSDDGVLLFTSGNHDCRSSIPEPSERTVALLMTSPDQERSEGEPSGTAVDRKRRGECCTTDIVRPQKPDRRLLYSAPWRTNMRREVRHVSPVRQHEGRHVSPVRQHEGRSGARKSAARDRGPGSSTANDRGSGKFAAGDRIPGSSAAGNSEPGSSAGGHPERGSSTTSDRGSGNSMDDRDPPAQGPGVRQTKTTKLRRAASSATSRVQSTTEQNSGQPPSYTSNDSTSLRNVVRRPASATNARLRRPVSSPAISDRSSNSDSYSLLSYVPGEVIRTERRTSERAPSPTPSESSSIPPMSLNRQGTFTLEEPSINFWASEGNDKTCNMTVKPAVPPKPRRNIPSPNRSPAALGAAPLVRPAVTSRLPVGGHRQRSNVVLTPPRTGTRYARPPQAGSLPSARPSSQMSKSPSCESGFGSSSPYGFGLRSSSSSSQISSPRLCLKPKPPTQCRPAQRSVSNLTSYLPRQRQDPTSDSRIDSLLKRVQQSRQQQQLEVTSCSDRRVWLSSAAGTGTTAVIQPFNYRPPTHATAAPPCHAEPAGATIEGADNRSASGYHKSQP